MGIADWFHPAYIAFASIAGGALWVGKIGVRVKANEDAIHNEIKPELIAQTKTLAAVDERTKVMLRHLQSIDDATRLR